VAASESEDEIDGDEGDASPGLFKVGGRDGLGGSPPINEGGPSGEDTSACDCDPPTGAAVFCARGPTRRARVAEADIPAGFVEYPLGCDSVLDDPLRGFACGPNGLVGCVNVPTGCEREPDDCIDVFPATVDEASLACRTLSFGANELS